MGRGGAVHVTYGKREVEFPSLEELRAFAEEEPDLSDLLLRLALRSTVKGKGEVGLGQMRAAEGKTVTLDLDKGSLTINEEE
jgi:hypothetical protein